MNLESIRSRGPLGAILLAAVCSSILVVAGTAPVAAGPASSPEGRVNTHAGGAHGDSDVAVSAYGDYVVTWTSTEQDDSIYGVYAQRFSAGGSALGPETRVNTTTWNYQEDPSIAIDADGDYVITWSSRGQDGSERGIYLQRFSSDGIPQGAETQVNTTTQNDQTSTDIAMDADGDFVVTWTSYGQDGSEWGVYSQRFDAAGNRLGFETRVNSTTHSHQSWPSVAMDADGDHVITWTSFDQDGGDYGVYSQRFNAAGFPRGDETRVNTTTAHAQFEPSVAMDADGDFVIGWSSWQQDGHDFGVYTQRYNAVGVPQGSETPVNTTTTFGQSDPSIAMQPSGGYVVSWSSAAQDGHLLGVVTRRYDATGLPAGAETIVNTTTTSSQYESSAGIDADGDRVVTWTSLEPDGYHVYGRRFRGPGTVDLALTQSDNTDAVAVNGRLVYRVRVANETAASESTGIEAIDGGIGAAGGVQVVSTVPDGATFLSSAGNGWTCGAPAATVRCKLSTTVAAGDVSPGLLLTYAAPDEAGPALHHARTSAVQLDPASANDVEVEQTGVLCALEFSDASFSQGEEGNLTATVARRGTGCGPASVAYSTSGLSASEGADFTGAAGNLALSEDDVNAVVSVPIESDGVDETNERFKILLTNPSGALLGARDVANGVITDDDDPPRVNFTSTGATRSESDALVDVTVQLSEVSGRQVVVQLVKAGTATYLEDYHAPKRVTIPAGQRSATFTVEVVDDAAEEGSESAVLRLSAPTGATIGTQKTYRLNITDND